MGVAEAIIGASLLSAGATAASSAANKPGKPPAAPKTTSEEDKAKLASDSANRQRKRAIAARGRGDTILTGPLGDVGQQQQQGGAKTLLGA